MSIFLKEVECCQCSVKFGLAAQTEAELRHSSHNFYCPYGHQQHFPQGESKEQKLFAQLEAERLARQRAEQRVAYQADMRREAEERAEKERRRANGYKGHATRITKRAKAGVCPCCNRTFENLRRHMDTKHPTFTPMPLEVIEGGKAA
jgi:hypothetical protein